MNQSTVDSKNLNNEGAFKVIVYEHEENGKVIEKGKIKRNVFKEAQAMMDGKLPNVSIKLEPNRKIDEKSAEESEEMTH